MTGRLRAGSKRSEQRVSVEHFFSGSAVGTVASDGAVLLPSFVRRSIEQRGGGRNVLFGAHETDRCATGFDAGTVARRQADLERRRLRDEEQGNDPADHHARARRSFGLLEEASYDTAGRIVLPPMMRRRAGIGDVALFVGTGTDFEIWNPQFARESGCDELRELAEYRLADTPTPSAGEGK